MGVARILAFPLAASCALASANTDFFSRRPDGECFKDLLKRRHLQIDYPTIPLISLREVPRVIKEGELDFIRLIKSVDPRLYSKNTSRVHKYEDIFGQAFILVLSSLQYPHEVLWKSKITFAAHWWDDLVDRPDGITYELLEQFVASPHDFLETFSKGPRSRRGIGPAVRVLKRLIDESPSPDLTLQAFVRLTYGGLIQRAPSARKQTKYLDEYREYSLRNVAEPVRTALHSFHPALFWMTTKTLFELMLQPELRHRATLAVLLDALFGSALYYHDAKAESAQGELHFFNRPDHFEEEQARLIYTVNHLLGDYEIDSAPLRVQQLQLTIRFVENELPPKVTLAYNVFLSNWKFLADTAVRYMPGSASALMHSFSDDEFMDALRASSEPVVFP